MIIAVVICAVLIPRRRKDIFADADSSLSEGSEEITDFIGFEQDFDSDKNGGRIRS